MRAEGWGRTYEGEEREGKDLCEGEERKRIMGKGGKAKVSKLKRQREREREGIDGTDLQ